DIYGRDRSGSRALTGPTTSRPPPSTTWCGQRRSTPAWAASSNSRSSQWPITRWAREKRRRATRWRWWARRRPEKEPAKGRDAALTSISIRTIFRKLSKFQLVHLSVRRDLEREEVRCH